MPLSKTSEIQSKSQVELLTQLQADVQKILDERRKEAQVEAEIVERAAQDGSSGGFWGDFTAGPISEAISEISTVFGDVQAVRDGRAALESLLSSAFDSATSLAGFITDSLQSVVDVGGLAADQVSALEKGRAFSFQKNILAADPYQRSAISATLASAVESSLNAVNSVSRAATSAFSTLSNLVADVPGTAEALMSVAANNLSGLVLDQDFLLDRLIAAVQEANKIAEDLQSKDYLNDRYSVVRGEQIRLAHAVGDIEVIKRQLTFGGPLHETLWGETRGHVADAARALCDSPSVSILPTRLAGYAAYIEYLLNALARSNAGLIDIRSNVGSFRADFQAGFRFDSIYAPILDAIQGRIDAIVADMGVALRGSSISRLLLKEKEWCLELIALKAGMKFIDRLGTKTTALNTAVATGFEADFGAAIAGDPGYTAQVIAAGRDYVRRVRVKAQRNLDPVYVTSPGESLIELARLAKERNGSLSSVTGGLVSSVALLFPGAVNAVTRFIGGLTTSGLTAVRDAIMSGDVKELVKIDPLSATVASRAATAAGVLAVKLAGGVAQADAVAISTVMEEDIRSERIATDLKASFAEKHLEEIRSYDVARYEDVQAALDRVARDLGQEPTGGQTLIPAPRQQ